MNEDEPVIELDEGYGRIKSVGVHPLIHFIDSGERDFFKAKDFVQLYE